MSTVNDRRKHHRKSRGGCTNCKARRVKCDEARPGCQNCLKRQHTCIYRESETLGISHPSTRSNLDVAAGSDRAGLQDQLPGQDARLSHPDSRIVSQRLHELYLMHNYSTVTFSTLANSDSVEEVYLWQRAIPREAMKHDFLMNGLLALSSLHLAHLEPSMSDSHADAAVRYQNSGLRSFQTSLDNITNENFDAVFGFSVILMLLSLAMSTSNSNAPCSSPEESLISIFKLLQRVNVLTRTSLEALNSGMFNVLLSGRPRCESVSQGGLDTALGQLRTRADDIAKYVGPERRQVYLACIDSLEMTFQEVATHERLGIILAWPVMVNNELMTLLQLGDPMAQLIWVHYGVLLLHVDNKWWGKDFGIRLIDSLCKVIHAVDIEWVPFTQWARDKAAAIKL